jgi:hypothetical protein
VLSSASPSTAAAYSVPVVSRGCSSSLINERRHEATDAFEEEMRWIEAAIPATARPTILRRRTMSQHPQELFLLSKDIDQQEQIQRARHQSHDHIELTNNWLVGRKVMNNATG